VNREHIQNSEAAIWRVMKKRRWHYFKCNFWYFWYF